MSRTNVIRSGLHGAALAALLATAGCGPGMTPSGVEVVVRRPPPRRVEVRPLAPGSGYVWVDGHYAWQGGDYVWIAGQWQHPPQASYRRWQAGRWVHGRGGWYWVEGHWQ